MRRGEKRIEEGREEREKEKEREAGRARKVVEETGRKGKEKCTKTRRCVAQLAGRDEGEKYPEGEIPSRWSGCARVLVYVSRLRRRDKEGSEWYAKKNRPRTKASPRRVINLSDKSGWPTNYLYPATNFFRTHLDSR